MSCFTKRIFRFYLGELELGQALCALPDLPKLLVREGLYEIVFQWAE